MDVSDFYDKMFGIEDNLLTSELEVMLGGSGQSTDKRRKKKGARKQGGRGQGAGGSKQKTVLQREEADLEVVSSSVK